MAEDDSSGRVGFGFGWRAADDRGGFENVAEDSSLSAKVSEEVSWRYSGKE